MESWKETIEEGIAAGSIRVSRRGAVNRQDLRAYTGGSSAEAQRAKKLVENELKKIKRAS